MGDFLVISVLLCVIGLIVYRMIQNKKSGRTACGCDCSKCSKCCSQQKQ